MVEFHPGGILATICLMIACAALSGCGPTAAAATSGLAGTSMSSMRADMEAQAAAAGKPGPDGKATDPVTAKAYRDAIACLDRVEAHMRKKQAARVASYAINTGLSFAGAAGDIAKQATDLATSIPSDPVSC